MLKERIKELCIANSTSFMKLESDLGLGSGAISKWDKSSPKAENLEKVANYFNVSVDYLLSRTDDPRPHPKYLGDPTPSLVLSPEEQKLVDMYRQLDDDMKKIALGQAKILSESNKK